MPTVAKRKHAKKIRGQAAPKASNSAPLESATPAAPGSTWLGRIKYALDAAVKGFVIFAAIRYVQRGMEPNCYGYAVDSQTRHFRLPGEKAGRPLAEVTCQEILAGAKADGLKKPLAYAPDGCSVMCPPQYHSVYALTGDTRTETLGFKIREGKDFHFYRQGKGKKIFYSHKPGALQPTNRDGSGNLIICPPKANNAFTYTRGIFTDTANYHDHCGYLCAPSASGSKKPGSHPQGKNR